MTGPGLIGPGAAWDEPTGQFRAALLLTVMTLLAIFIPILLCVPPAIQEVPVDLAPLECSGNEPFAGPYHHLDIDSGGRILLDGIPRADQVALRVGLDIIGLDPATGVEMRPDPNLRYETFLQILATAEKARTPHLRVVGNGIMYGTTGPERCWAL